MVQLIKIKNISPVLLALVLTWPLISQSVPYVGLLFFLLIIFGVLSSLNLLGSVAVAELWRDSLWRMLFLMNITFFYGMFLSLTAVTLPVIKDAVRGVAFLFIWTIVLQMHLRNQSENILKIIEGFSKVILFVSIALAVLGAAKYIMSLNGVRLDFLKGNSQLYPWGTSLVGDYNFYSLTLFIGGFITLRYWVCSTSSLRAGLYGGIFTVLFCVALLAGSRRFWVVSPILFGVYLYYINRVSKGLNIKLKWRDFIAGVVVVLLFLSGYRYISNPVCIDSVDKVECLSHASQIDSRSAEFIQSKGVSGVPSRTERWMHVFNGEITAKLLGGGFGYRKDYGCLFNKCKVDDYPHAPILSAFLYGGLVAAFLTAALFFYALFIAYQLIKSRSIFADLAFGLVAVVIFSSVSGDTLFSLPVFFSMLIIARCALYVYSE